MTKTEIGIKAPRFWLYPPKLEFYLTLPGGKQIGPNSLTGGINVTGLPPGEYQLSGQFPGFDPFSIHLSLKAGEPLAVTPMQGATLAQRRALRRAQDGSSTILYLNHRRRHIAQFWLGHCDSIDRLGDLLSEEAFYDIEDEELRDDAPQNAFIQSQGQRWYDQDFLEAGFETGSGDLGTRFGAYSYAAEWAPKVEHKAGQLGVKDPNCFIMLGGDAATPENWRLDNPTDIRLPGIELRYLGEIDFTDYDGGPPGR
ncbi:MAG: hypothetical protein DI616_06025 [Paracoccus denitrificans]|uniref:Uncharacterized protein n=1 Tax=Paracoccus denitrificans TaxID=266 RepID=A0A533I9N3_PARDE|nr:MAG: hypothetical protein DI616_06025 [Paracoccus denitrificans]